MANTKSAEKRARQSLKRNERNRAIKSQVRTKLRAAREAIATGDAAKITPAVAAATSALSRAGSKGTLHDNNVSRRVGRLSAAAHRATSGQ